MLLRVAAVVPIVVTAIVIILFLIITGAIILTLAERAAIAFVTETSVTLNVVDAPAVNAAVTDAVVKVVLAAAAMETGFTMASVDCLIRLIIGAFTPAVSACTVIAHACTDVRVTVTAFPAVVTYTCVITKLVHACSAVLTRLRGAFIKILN